MGQKNYREMKWYIKRTNSIGFRRLLNFIKNTSDKADTVSSKDMFFSFDGIDFESSYIIEEFPDLSSYNRLNIGQATKFLSDINNYQNRFLKANTIHFAGIPCDNTVDTYFLIGNNNSFTINGLTSNKLYKQHSEIHYSISSIYDTLSDPQDGKSGLGSCKLLSIKERPDISGFPHYYPVYGDYVVIEAISNFDFWRSGDVSHVKAYGIIDTINIRDSIELRAECSNLFSNFDIGTNGYMFHKRSEICYDDKGSTRKWRYATPDEKKWMTGCIKSKHYTPFDSIDNFIVPVSKKIKKLIVTEMTNNTAQSIKRSDLSTLYKRLKHNSFVSGVLYSLATADPFATSITVNQSVINELIKNSSQMEINVISKYLTVYMIRIKGFDPIRTSNDDVLIEMRTFGEYSGTGLKLSSGFNWEIIVDNQGVKCLVPTKK